MSFTPSSVGIVGMGTMGIGMAQVFALAGCKVLLYDTNKESLENATPRIEGILIKAVEKGIISKEKKNLALSQVYICKELSDVRGDLIIEAIIENLEIKRQLFMNLEANNSNETILATNTSSIPITQISSVLKHPERFLGIHFFNPAHIMKLVEVIAGVLTDRELIRDVMNWIQGIGKSPVLVADSPGFIVNRVARSFYTESLKHVEEKKATFQGVDRLLESSGFRMGPFRLMDLIGIDTNYSVTTSMYEQFHQESRFKPSRLQQQYVSAGWHGKKSGKGFYSYD